MPEYVVQNSERILDSIHKKGWEVYDSTGVRNREEAVVSLSGGPATVLTEGRRYVLMPKIKDSDNPEKLFEELERAAVKIGRRMTIDIEGISFAWTGFIPKRDEIKVNTSEGHYISYSEFLSSLDSIPKI